MVYNVDIMTYEITLKPTWWNLRRGYSPTGSEVKTNDIKTKQDL